MGKNPHLAHTYLSSATSANGRSCVTAEYFPLSHKKEKIGLGDAGGGN